MSYSCSDFTDDVITAFIEAGALPVSALDGMDDDPEAQADLVIRALHRIIKQRDTLLAALELALVRIKGSPYDEYIAHAMRAAIAKAKP